jgi:hypothetical protein
MMFPGSIHLLPTACTLGLGSDAASQVGSTVVRIALLSYSGTASRIGGRHTKSGAHADCHAPREV